jgi:hypothetical protein
VKSYPFASHEVDTAQASIGAERGGNPPSQAGSGARALSAEVASRPQAFGASEDSPLPVLRGFVSFGQWPDQSDTATGCGGTPALSICILGLVAETHPIVQLHQRQLRFDLGQGNDSLQPSIYFPNETLVRPA